LLPDKGKAPACPKKFIIPAIISTLSPPFLPMKKIVVCPDKQYESEFITG
jgi:hypothetical protein